MKGSDNISKKWNNKEEEEFSIITSKAYSIYNNLSNSFC